MSRYVNHCGACGDTGHKRGGCPRIFTCKPPPKELPRWSETIALREAVWEQLSLRFPVTARVLFERVESEWGEVGERRLWRALEWNRQRRRVVRVEVETDDGVVGGYVRRAA